MTDKSDPRHPENRADRDAPISAKKVVRHELMREMAVVIHEEDDCTDQLCRTLYGRGARPADYLGGSNATMLHDAAVRIETQNAEITMLKDQLRSQAASAKMGMDAAKHAGHIMKKNAEALYARCGPEALESERAANAQLTVALEVEVKRRFDLRARADRLRGCLQALADAAECYAADQSGATDFRVGAVQPVTVAEAEALNSALTAARDALGTE